MLEGHLFQLGYVCDDIEEGIAQFRGRGMTHEPMVLEVKQPVIGPDGKEVINHIKLCFIWIGEIQYELIQAITDPLGVYANAPSNGGPIRFHQTSTPTLSTRAGMSTAWKVPAAISSNTTLGMVLVDS